MKCGHSLWHDLSCTSLRTDASNGVASSVERIKLMQWIELDPALMAASEPTRAVSAAFYTPLRGCTFRIIAIGDRPH